MSSDIAHIDWNVQGKIWKITHTTGSTHPDLEFKYDPMGHRLCKIVKHGPHQEDGWDYTYYVRDAQGQELATYTKAIATDPAHTEKYKATYQLQQNDLYGSKRLGVMQRNQLLTTATNTIGGHNADGTITETTTPSATTATPSTTNFAHHAGTRYYELANHLGNVLATIKDVKIPHDDNTDGVTDYYTASIAGANDYYSFGSIMPNANNKTNDDYKFGFNGKRNDNEIKGVGNSVDFGARIYDPRIIVWGSVDLLATKYASFSPYVFCANNPMMFIDNDGKENIIYLVALPSSAEVLKKVNAIAIEANKNFQTLGVNTRVVVYENKGKFSPKFLDKTDSYALLGSPEEIHQTLAQEDFKGNGIEKGWDGGVGNPENSGKSEPGIGIDATSLQSYAIYNNINIEQAGGLLLDHGAAHNAGTKHGNDKGTKGNSFTDDGDETTDYLRYKPGNQNEKINLLFNPDGNGVTKSNMKNRFGSKPAQDNYNSNVNKANDTKAFEDKHMVK